MRRDRFIKVLQISGAVFLSLLILSQLVALYFEGRPAAFVFPADPNAFDHSPNSRFSRIISSLKGKIFRPRTLDMQTVVFKLPHSPSEQLVKEFTPTDPVFADSNGLKIWMIDLKSLQRFSTHLTNEPGIQTMAAQRTLTAGGIPVWAKTGNQLVLDGATNFIGLDLRFLPRLRDASTRLTILSTVTELLTNTRSGATTSNTVCTNLSLGAKLRIPRSSGVLVISRDSPTEKALAVLLFPTQR